MTQDKTGWRLYYIDWMHACVWDQKASYHGEDLCSNHYGRNHFEAFFRWVGLIIIQVPCILEARCHFQSYLSVYAAT